VVAPVLHAACDAGKRLSQPRVEILAEVEWSLGALPDELIDRVAVTAVPRPGLLRCRPRGSARCRSDPGRLLMKAARPVSGACCEFTELAPGAGRSILSARQKRVNALMRIRCPKELSQCDYWRN